MQSLELSCQESDFKLNDTLNKIKGHQTSTVTETTTTLTTRLPSNTQHQNRHQTLNNIQNVQNVQNSPSNESNSTMTTHSTAAATVTSHSRTNNNNSSNSSNNSTDRLPSSKKQTSPPTASSSTHDGGGSGNDGTANATNTSEKQSPSNSSVSGNTTDSTFFNIHEKLRELYVYLYLKDIQDTQVDNRIKLKSRSFVLETLVARENLNTVILNLYPGNKGYSLAFRQEYLPQNKKYDGLHSIYNRNKSQLFGATEVNNMNCVRQEKEEHLLETVRWPYENGDLLEAINKEELPILYMKLLLTYAPNAFYSGCVIIEVRDYRQSFPISTCCDNYYVLLKPTTQTLLADARILSNEEDFTYEDRIALESNMVLATAAPLCLDPSPKVAQKAFYSQHKRQMWNTSAIRRQMRKFSQVAINRKRKTDQFTHAYDSDLSDYLFRTRQRPPRHLLSNPTFENALGYNKVPRKASDIMKPICVPNFDLPPALTPPSDVDIVGLIADAIDPKSPKSPEDVLDSTPQFMEQYTLEADRADGAGLYLIKLTVSQRGSNLEYVGELYVDRDHSPNRENGEACRFSLGSLLNAQRYIQQFKDIFTEEGRKPVKITHKKRGHAPMLVNLDEPTYEETMQMQLQQEQRLQQRIQQLRQQRRTGVGVTNPLNQPHITASQINNHQKKAITLKSPVLTHGIPTAEIPGSPQTQPKHLKIANGSVVMLKQEQSSGNISLGVATITSQQAQNQTSSTSQQGIVTNSLPLLAQITNKTITQSTVSTAASNEVNTLVTGIIQSPTHSLQNQAGNSQTHKSSNAAIISLLNSAPAAMTSSAVVNTLNTPSNSPVTIPIQRLIATHTASSADNLQQSQQAQTQTVLLNQQDQQPQPNVRVTMSALASQLASPPALMSNSPINPSNFNFAQIKSQQVTAQSPQHQQQQQILINNNNKIRRDSLAAPSPGSDSNASSASSTNLGNFQSITPGFPFIGSASPTTSIISNECSSGSIERVPSADKNFHEHSMCGPSPVSSGSSFMTPSPKNNANVTASPLSSPTHHQLQAESPSTPNTSSAFQIRKQSIVNATSNDSTNQNQSNQPQVAQTTTLNLHGINFSSLQGAMAQYPRLQNVQVQIPGLAQPISLSLTGTAANSVATATSHPPGLQLESMPVSLGQPTQTVVLTTASQQGQGPVLSLPIAQLVAASNVKNLTPQQLRNVSVNLASQSNQQHQQQPQQQQQQQQQQPNAHIQQQRPRSVPTITTSTLNAKQLAARGLIASQRNIAVASNSSAQMKITTPITMASVPHATTSNMGAVNNNPMLVQLQLQKHHQTQQFHHQNQHQ